MTFALPTSAGGYPMIGNGFPSNAGYPTSGLAAASPAYGIVAMNPGQLVNPPAPPSAAKAQGRVQTIQPAGLGTYVEDFVGSIPAAVGGTIENYWQTVKGAGTSVAVSAGHGIQTIASDASAGVQNAYNGVKNVATSISTGAENTITGAEKTVTGFATGVQADIQGAFSIIPWIFGLAVLGVGVFAYLEAKKAGLI